MHRALRLLAPFGVAAGTGAFLIAPSWTIDTVVAPLQPIHAYPPTTAHADDLRARSRLPASFVPNLGQWRHPACYVGRIGAMTVFLEEQGWTIALVDRAKEIKKERKEKPRGGIEGGPEDFATRGAAVRMTFVGADRPVIAAENRLEGCHNYFLGNDPARWRCEVPIYAAVRYNGVYPGVDVRIREQDRSLEYDLLLVPDANLESVEIQVEGSAGIRIDTDGALVLETGIGPLRMPIPMSWEEGPSGEQALIACRYVLLGQDRFGFEASGRRPGWALVVDPGLAWSTFLGGTDYDSALDTLALDAQGAATIAGYTYSTDFPTTPGAFATSHNGDSDAYVTRLSPTGTSLLYSTFLGGSVFDCVFAIALDAQGAATIAGGTTSTDFPTTPGAYDTSQNGRGDAFVARLSPTGARLLYSTFLGGTGTEYPRALALDAQGAATVVGFTLSADFPVTPGALATSHCGKDDAFVTRLSPTGASLLFSTFLGGKGIDTADALALDSQGAATIAGSTDSPDFPITPGAFATSQGGMTDAFIARLSPTGASLIYSTFIGGTDQDYANSLALDALGAATIAGHTLSADFPTTPGAYATGYNGGIYDAFVTRLSPTGANLIYSTFLGGKTSDFARALALDTRSAATIVGLTTSTDFPTTPGAFDTSHNGHDDAFVTRLSPTGARVIYSTFLGGNGYEYARALALDAQGAATVAGWTNSTDFPTTPFAFSTKYNGGANDAFVTRLDLLPAGVARYGSSSQGCTGSLPISVTSMPFPGNAAFALTCGNAPPTSTGIVPLGLAGLTTPLPLLGVGLWVDPISICALPSVVSDSLGAAELPLPIPKDSALVGGRVYAQFVWVGPNTPPPCPPLGLSATSALEIMIQP